MSVTMSDRPLRADARRNYDAIVAAAAAELDRVGSRASLEEIARRAGVGSATLHRRFPARRQLLQAVFAERIHALADRADTLLEEQGPGGALRSWLVELAECTAQTRGLAEAFAFDGAEIAGNDCEVALTAAASRLIRAGQQVGMVRSSVSALNLLLLVNGISLISQNHTGSADTARALALLALDGIFA